MWDHLTTPICTTVPIPTHKIEGPKSGELPMDMVATALHGQLREKWRVYLLATPPGSFEEKQQVAWENSTHFTTISLNFGKVCSCLLEDKHCHNTTIKLFICVLVMVSSAMIKLSDQKLREERAYSSYSLWSIIQGSQNRILEAGEGHEAMEKCCLLPSFSWLTQLLS